MKSEVFCEMKIEEGIERIWMFCNCTGQGSKEIALSLQKSKSLGTCVTFTEKIWMKENWTANNIRTTEICVVKYLSR